MVGDVDGDGQEEIVIGTYNPEKNPSDGTLYVFSLDGVLKFSLPVPGGLKHIPTLADVRGDGLDVIYRSLAGRIYIQNFGATNAGPVSWSTHRGNRKRDGNLGISLFPSGTPLITHKEASFRRAGFSWGGSATNTAKARAGELGGARWAAGVRRARHHSYRNDSEKHRRAGDSARRYVSGSAR